jgi:hypothetical protein
MDAGPPAGTRPREVFCHNSDLSDAVYGMFPSRAPTSVYRSHAPSPAKASSKRQSTADSSPPPPLSIRIARSTASPSWLPQSKRTRFQAHQRELHQSTCLNLNVASDDSTDSDLWILPDFDDWELDSETIQQTAAKKDGEWAPLLQRAASSNRERLRARLEGDGWDFVGGKYGEDGKVMQEAASQSEDSVDEEFDVVVLPLVHISC